MDERQESSNVIIENRKKMTVSGVQDVISFDDESILLDTQLGSMVIKGCDFKINKLNVDSGELVIEGHIVNISYGDSVSKDSGFSFAKLFR